MKREKILVWLLLVFCFVFILLIIVSKPTLNVFGVIFSSADLIGITLLGMFSTTLMLDEEDKK